MACSRRSSPAWWGSSASAASTRWDPTLGTAVRAVIMAAALALAALALGKMQGVTSIPRGALLWDRAERGLRCGSWLAYFWPFACPAGPVAALDRLSVVFALVFAALSSASVSPPLPSWVAR